MEKINSKLIFVPIEDLNSVSLSGWCGGAFADRDDKFGQYFYKD